MRKLEKSGTYKILMVDGDTAKTKADRYGSPIGDGTWHADYEVFDLSAYGIRSAVTLSNTSESVYVSYIKGEGLDAKEVEVRYSNHCNGLGFEGYDNGRKTMMRGIYGNDDTRKEILALFGYLRCVFVPDKKKFIRGRNVGKKSIGDYEAADVTLDELLALDEGSDISVYTGKIAKGGNWLIEGSVVETREETTGKYVYFEK